MMPPVVLIALFFFQQEVCMGIGTSIGVLGPAAMHSDTRVQGYDKKLRAKALVTDIWTKLSGIYDPEKDTVPKDKILIKIDSKALAGSIEATITMKLKLRGTAVYGNNNAIGTEERPVTKSMKVYCNNLRKVVTTPGYGRRKLEGDPYGLYEQHIDDLSDWNKEHEGLEIRSGFVEQYGETLPFGDTAGTCVRNFHPKIFVCGLGSHANAKPAYSTNKATYSTNIVQKVIDAGGGDIAPTAGQTLNQPNASHLMNMAVAERITPIKIPGLPGGSGWVVIISELQAMYFGDPAWSARNFGSLYKDITQLNDKVMKWDGVVGSWKKLLFIEDPRMPTLMPSGSSAPYGLTAGYLRPGDVDERNRDERDVIDLFMLCGEAAMWQWTPEKLHHIQQTDDYGAVKGHGTALVRGCGLVAYDRGLSDGEGTELFGSILGLCRLPAYV